MTYSTELRDSLTKILDQRSLVRLAADVLLTRRHSSIRPTDGPGDGGRDIHSLNPSDNPHLTQCKYHKDATQTCSSTELSELPMAMTKLDYKHGLFLTNAKISPQAKREYLNDYPDLELDFLDGEELAREVLSNGVLTGLWWEGTQFSQINVSTIFPMIISCTMRTCRSTPLRVLPSKTRKPFLNISVPDTPIIVSLWSLAGVLLSRLNPIALQNL